FQAAAATATGTAVAAEKPLSTGTPVKLPLTGPPAQAASQKAGSVKAEGTTATQTSTTAEMLENVRKCKNFLAALLKLASSGSQAPEMGQNVKNLVQNLLEAKIEPEEFIKKLYLELKSSPQPYLVPFLKKSVFALRQLMPNAQSFIQQCLQQPAPTQQAVLICTSAAPTTSTAVATSAVATTSLPVAQAVAASGTAPGSPVVHAVLACASATAPAQPLQPVPPAALGPAALQPAPAGLTTTTAAAGLTAIQTGKPVFTSAVATSSLQAAKPVLGSTAAPAATASLQPLKPGLGTPVSIKISQPNSMVSLAVGAQQGIKVKQLVVQQASGTVVKQVSTVPQPSTLTLQTAAEERRPLKTLVQTNQMPPGSIVKQITLPGNKILSIQASPVQKVNMEENGATSFR
ncbi:TAF4B factor, partial [Bucco capensis]|nr:TAF4B factor [Bucco capensis]